MRDHLVIYINGVRHRLAYDDAVITMADFLRRRLGQVGTKIVCNEGDCGACSVLVGRPNADCTQMSYQTVDACIAFPFQLDRTHIVTVEGLGGIDTLTPVQEAMIRCHGSQCGFCTPGFVVAIHGMLEEALTLGDEQLRCGLSGNLCRCTGYSQILDAAKSIEPGAITPLAERYHEQEMLSDLGECKATVQLSNGHRIWIPDTLTQAVKLRAAHPEATIVNGATDYGVLFNHGRTTAGDVICLTAIDRYRSITTSERSLRIGGGATWTQIERFVDKLFPPYHAILTRFGSPQIRNAGTLAGNLAGGSPIADATPFHMVMDSTVELISTEGTRTVAVNEFYTGYRQTVMEPSELIAAVDTPLLGKDERLVLYKISKRRDMDISTLTFALWIRLDDGIIDASRLALGGVGPTVMRMVQAEQHLQGKPWSLTTMQEAGVIARAQIEPWSDVRGSANYRWQLAENLMTKAYHEVTDGASRSERSVTV